MRPDAGVDAWHTAPAAPTLYARSSNTVLRNMSLGSVPNAPCFVRAAWARGNSNSATPPPAVAAAACEPQIKQGTSTRARSPHGTAPDSTPRERAHTMAAHHNAALACRTQQRGPGDGRHASAGVAWQRVRGLRSRTVTAAVRVANVDDVLIVATARVVHHLRQTEGLYQQVRRAR